MKPDQTLKADTSQQPKVLKWKNLRIHTFGKDEVAIVAHGGYTPRRGSVQTGSGKSSAEIPIVFYSHPNQAAINCARTLIEGTAPVKTFETSPKGSEIENYSLKNDPDFEKAIGIINQPVMDFITIAGSGKAHMEEVWDAIRLFGLKYTKLHFVACRINKLTFDIEKLPISRND